MQNWTVHSSSPVTNNLHYVEVKSQLGLIDAEKKNLYGTERVFKTEL